MFNRIRGLLRRPIPKKKSESLPSGFKKAIRRLDIKSRESVIAIASTPRHLNIGGSNLSLHAHSVTEDSRIRKFKEPWTIEWLRSLPPGSFLYDVGANIGVTALIAAERPERNITVVAIEPFPANFTSLVKNTLLNKLGNRVIPLPIGLGAKTQIVPFHWASTKSGTSMHAFTAIVSPKSDKPVRQVAEHYCMCYRLDDLVHMGGLPFPTHIKIDVDGGELPVLEGARSVLADARCRGIQLEVYKGTQPELSRVAIELVESAGFTVIATYPHLHEGVEDIQFERTKSSC